MVLSFEKYNRREGKIYDVINGYNEVAQDYDEISTAQIETPILEKIDAVEWGNVNYVADLACGTGRIGDWLKCKNKCMIIDGIDINREMIQIAKKKNLYRNIFERNMLETNLESNKYELVTNSLAICHISELEKFYCEVNRLCCKGGNFFLIDYHPFFLLNGIPTRLESKSGCKITIKNYIHMISDHIRLGKQNGFELINMVEAIITEEWVKRVPEFERYIMQPVSFGMLWLKRHNSYKAPVVKR